MAYFYFFLGMIGGLLIVIWPLTILLHELGHAIPAILLTKEKVKVFIGSYGNEENSICIKLGLLEIFWYYKGIFAKKGLCVPTAKDISVNKQIIYTLAGPLTSSVISSTLAFLIFSYDLHGFFKLAVIVFCLSSISDLIVNLWPFAILIKLHNQHYTYNDGYSLRLLFYYKKFPKKFDKAIALYEEGKYREAGRMFDTFLKKDLQHHLIYRYALSCKYLIKEYQEAYSLYQQLPMQFEKNTDDFVNWGICCLYSNKYDEAMKAWDESLVLNSENKYALNNKGYLLCLQENYADAIPFLNKAIEQDENFANPYSSRALAKIKMGAREEGLKDIELAMSLDKGNSYTVMHYGVYYLEEGNASKALELFEEAKRLDSSTIQINERIQEAQKLLQ